MEHLPQFNIVDIIAMTLMAIGLIRGLAKGLSGELAGLLSACAALVAGWYFYKPFGGYLTGVTRLSERGAYALAFALTLVGAYILMRILRIVLRSLMEFSFKGNLERIGGALAGLIRMTVFSAALILVASLWPNDYVHEHFAVRSSFGRLLYDHLGPVYENLSEKYPALKIPTKEGEAESMVGEAEGTAEHKKGHRTKPQE